MPAAIAIPAVISAAGSIGAAAIGSHAAKDAAKTQTDSADKALALQTRIYDENKSNLAPWVSQGQQAATTLGGLMGLPATGGGGGGSAATPTGPFTRAGSGSTVAVPGTYQGQAILRNPDRVPGTDLQSAQPRGTLGAFNPQSAAGQRTSSYVTMRSPDGKETMPVPAQHVDHYRQLGATVIS